MLQTFLARERAQDYAVATIAGIAAECEFSGTPIADLRQTSGKDDYIAVDSIVRRLMVRRGFEQSQQIYDSYVILWEARATALMEQPQVWSAVQFLAFRLSESEQVTGRHELLAVIKEGFELNVSG